MSEVWDSVGRALSYILTAIVAGVTAYFARKKAKEDNNLATIGHALETWQHLAESNKKHWDDCEKQTEQLNREVKDLRANLLESQVQLIDLRQQVSLLTIQIERMKNEE